MLLHKFKMGRKVLRKGEAPQAEHTALYDRVTKIEADVLARVRDLKAKPFKLSVCDHLGPTRPDAKDYIQGIDYFDLYWKQYMLNYVGIEHARNLEKETSEFERKLKKIDTLLDQREEALKPFQLKREKAAVLDFSCYLCTKAFKDQDTLLLHHKIKHSSSPQESLRENEEPSVEIYDSEEE